MTHLDFDHAAGLVDFPGARIHLSAAEANAAQHPRGPKNRERYRPAQFGASEPRWRTYPEFTTTWFEIPAIPIDGVPGVMLISRWLLHAADAIFNHSELDWDAPSMPTAARAYQWFMQTSQVQRRRSLKHLRRLAHDHSGEIEVICTHDPSLLKDSRLSGA